MNVCVRKVAFFVVTAASLKIVNGAFVEWGRVVNREAKTMKQGKAFCVNFWLFHVSRKLWINFHSSCGWFRCLSGSAIDFLVLLFYCFSCFSFVPAMGANEKANVKRSVWWNEMRKKYRKGKIDGNSCNFSSLVRCIVSNSNKAWERRKGYEKKKIAEWVGKLN